jgi:hypothetical protein
LIFALAIIYKGKYKYILLLIAISVAGIKILSIFPAWIIGFLIYKYKFHRNIGWSFSVVATISGALGILFSPEIHNYFIISGHYVRSTMIGDNLDALFFGFLFIGVYGIVRGVNFEIKPLGYLIKYFASLTFALYLFHRPLLAVFTLISGQTPEYLHQKIMVLAGPMVFVMIVGYWCEKKKHYYRKLIDRVIP